MRVSGYLYVLEQWGCAVSMLYAAGRAAGIPRTAPLRLMLVSLLTAAASTLAAVFPALLMQLTMLLTALLSPLALWPGLPRRLRLTLPPSLLVLTLTAAGCIRFLHVLPIPPALSVLAACWCIPLLVRTPSQTLPRCASVEIRCGASRVTLTALVDSGNLLRDPLTALPVIVISRRAAQRLIPLPRPGQLNPGLRQITVRTIAGLTPMTVFRPSSLRLMHGSLWRETQAMIGIAPDGYDGVQALVPAALLSSSSITLTQGG